MESDNKKTEYMSRKDLEEQTQILLAAFDERFDKLDDSFGKRFVQIDTILDKRLTRMEDRLSKDINNVQTLIDGYVKAQEGFRQEFEIMKAEFGQMKKIIKEKLGLEIKTV